MCRYSYSNGKCANIDVIALFCIGDKNCSLSNFLHDTGPAALTEDETWKNIPSRIWKIGKNPSQE